MSVTLASPPVHSPVRIAKIATRCVTLAAVVALLIGLIVNHGRGDAAASDASAGSAMSTSTAAISDGSDVVDVSADELQEVAFPIIGAVAWIAVNLALRYGPTLISNAALRAGWFSVPGWARGQACQWLRAKNHVVGRSFLCWGV